MPQQLQPEQPHANWLTCPCGPCAFVRSVRGSTPDLCHGPVNATYTSGSEYVEWACTRCAGRGSIPIVDGVITTSWSHQARKEVAMSLHLTPAQIAEGTVSAFVAGIMTHTGLAEAEVRAIAEMTAIVTHKPISAVVEIWFNVICITEERLREQSPRRA